MAKPKRPVRPKTPWVRVDGVLLLDKPAGMSSNSALQKARHLFLAEKGGHTGTLDPMATGLLPLCFGEATKFSHDLLEADKTYIATVKLGERTNTGDADGELLETQPIPFDASSRLPALLPFFTGLIKQVPPMYSALKRDGVPLYKLARQGIEVERTARTVCIHELQLIDCALPKSPFVEIKVRCSKGTYIRSLAEDIGAALGCGAHLTALRRTAVGRLSIDNALTLEQLQLGFASGTLLGFLQNTESLLQEFPALTIAGLACERFCHGNPASDVLPPSTLPGAHFRVYADNEFLGLGQSTLQGNLQPKRLVRPLTD